MFFLNLTAESPTITGIGVSGGGTSIAQNTWVSIYGIDLAPASLGPGGLTWSTAPSFASGQMPTVLDTVTVTVNGKPAYIYYVSGSQVNVLTPLDSSTGPVSVTVYNGNLDQRRVHREPAGALARLSAIRRWRPCCRPARGL